MKLEFFNCPKQGDIKNIQLPEKPEFMKYIPDFTLMEKLAKDYEKYQNILVIGHGGSINSVIACYYPLEYLAKKKIYFLSTVDPDYIFELKKTLKPENTLIVATSKSGENITQIEALMQFVQFPLIIVTGKASSLRAVGEKLNAKIILHPNIGGRFNSFTEIGLLPLSLAGIPAETLVENIKSVYSQYNSDNLAWRAASVLYQLEEKGFVDVFMPFYSHNLFPVSALIIQLCHESFGKNGKGQTYFAHEAPESQHHTNQRFFGGKKNICGFFQSTETFLHPTQYQLPSSIHSVQIKEHVFFDLNKIPLEKAMEFECAGTLEDARIQGIPLAHLSVSGFSPQEIANYIAFWQLYAIYSSVLRKVNPFDQPQVENSKKISFNKRLQFKGLL